jgi:hypothetical protein
LRLITQRAHELEAFSARAFDLANNSKRLELEKEAQRVWQQASKEQQAFARFEPRREEPFFPPSGSACD